jgi:hypothetical protein
MLLDCRNCGTRFDTKACLGDGDCCSDRCKGELHRRLLTPYSVPHPAGTEIRRPAPPTRQEQARAALAADRAAPPRRTLSLRDAEAALSRERTPDQTRRLLDREEDEMKMRAKGLNPHHRRR